MRGRKPKGSTPVEGGVLSPSARAGVLRGSKPGSDCVVQAQSGVRAGGGRALCRWDDSNLGHEPGVRVGTDLLSPVDRESRVQRFSSTAVYPTIRGARLPHFSTLAARGLRDTLLPRYAVP